MLFEYSFILYFFYYWLFIILSIPQKAKDTLYIHSIYKIFTLYLMGVWEMSPIFLQKKPPPFSLTFIQFSDGKHFKIIYRERTLFAYGVVRHHSHTLRSILENEKKLTTLQNHPLFHFSHPSFQTVHNL